MPTFNRYVEDADGDIIFKSPDAGPAAKKLAAGVYMPFILPGGIMGVTPKHIKADEVIPMKGDTASEIMDDIDRFFDPKTCSRYNRFGMVYKRGVLLHGKPGTGKSVAIYRVIDAAVKADMIVLLDPSPGLVATFVNAIRQLENNPTRRFLIIWEEMDEQLKKGHETTILSLLDGEHTLEHVIYLATTNYIYQIPERIRNRPSRFALVVEAQPPSEHVRRTFFAKKFTALTEDDAPQDIDLWVAATSGMVIDNLKDLFISVVVFQMDFLTAVNKLRVMSALPVIKDMESLVSTIEADGNQKKKIKEERQDTLGEIKASIARLEENLEKIADECGVDITGDDEPDEDEDDEDDDDEDEAEA